MLKVSPTNYNDSRKVVNFCLQQILVSSVLVFWSPLGAANQNVATKTRLFLVGSTLGLLCYSLYLSGISFCLKKLKGCSSDFMVKSNSVFGRVEVPFIIACICQLQTIQVFNAYDQETFIVVKALLLLAGPTTFLLAMSVWHAISVRGFEANKRFGWPRPVFSINNILTMRFFQIVGVGNLEDNSFHLFCDSRSAMFAAHLETSKIQQGPDVAKSSSICAKDLKTHLKSFDTLGTDDRWWNSPATLKQTLLSNHAAFRKRIELVKGAKKSIFVSTWALDGESGRLLGKLLIEQAQRGLDVRVIVDAINLCYLNEKNKLAGKTSSSLDLLKVLRKGGVKVHMLDKWYLKDTGKPYIIGTHRKMTLVDNAYLVTGGRNLDDAYSRFEGGKRMHFQDVDVCLEGDFAASTTELYEQLWAESKALDTVFEDLNETRVELSTVESSSPDDKKAELDLEYFSQLKPPTKPQEVPHAHFFRQWSELASTELEHPVSLFQLDHKAGNPSGNDIILSSLYFLIENAEKSVDLCIGYFQLFPCLEEALRRAVARGVKIRLFTNSRKTNDLTFFNDIFRQSFITLREMGGVEIYEPSDIESDSDSDEDDEPAEFCLHYKMVVVDSKAVLVGSWNCFGISVFYDAEFSIIMIAEEDEQLGQSESFKQITDFFEGSIANGRFVILEEVPPKMQFPMLYNMVTPANAKRQMTQGY